MQDKKLPPAQETVTNKDGNNADAKDACLPAQPVIVEGFAMATLCAFSAFGRNLHSGYYATCLLFCEETTVCSNL